jgi:hypothetical protein
MPTSFASPRTIAQDFSVSDGGELPEIALFLARANNFEERRLSGYRTYRSRKDGHNHSPAEGFPLAAVDWGNRRLQPPACHAFAFAESVAETRQSTDQEVSRHHERKTSNSHQL